MTAFEEKTQALMDEVYSEWNKEENNGQGKWDILNRFSEAHQIAVVFGNFNYQVENGGLKQWIYNGYFHDDAKKFIEFLEVGTKLDERCRKILDSIYKLDQHAQETGCDRDGNYHDIYDEDGETSFIGDMMDCNAFDTWYYEHCGNDDWWEMICGIIENVEGRNFAPAHQNEHNGESAVSQHPLRVYVENANKPENGGFTMPLPTTPEKLRPFLEGIELISTFLGGRFDFIAGNFVSNQGTKPLLIIVLIDFWLKRFIHRRDELRCHLQLGIVYLRLLEVFRQAADFILIKHSLHRQAL